MFGKLANLYKIVNNVRGFKLLGFCPHSKKYQFIFSLNLVHLKAVVSLCKMFVENEGLSFQPWG